MKWINVDLKSVERLISRLIDEYNYDMLQVEEGCLGFGDVVMLPPDNKHYFFIIREYYLNEWSSGHKYMKCRKLPKEWDKKVDAVWQD